ncbi:MAG: acetyl-CoA hydrolase, partial [Thermodesulfobacteriota bacterium]
MPNNPNSTTPPTEDCYRHKVVSARAALSQIKRGSRVFIGTGCGEPRHLIETMVATESLQDITLYQMLSIALARFVHEPAFLKRFALKLFFISQPLRKAAFEGKIDYIPAYLSQIPGLFSSHRI